MEVSCQTNGSRNKWSCSRKKAHQNRGKVKKAIVSDTDEDVEISLHDESDDDEDLEDGHKGIAEDKGDKQQVTISNSDIGKYFVLK